jgi:restriction system protein
MARRGFFAQLNRQMKIAAREQERRQRIAIREQSAEARRREQHSKTLARLGAQYMKAEAAERKRLEKEQREAYLESRQDEAEARSEDLAAAYEEIDNLLQATLDRDDFVDLTTLKVKADHPPFDRADLEVSIIAPSPSAKPTPPVLKLPDPPSALAMLFSKRKHEASVETARSAHARAVAEWESACTLVERQYQETLAKYTLDEQQRLDNLEREQLRYAQECKAREDDAADQNRSLDEFIVNLGYGTPEAIQEYVAIVLGNSVYPEQFSVQHSFTFDSGTAELALRVGIPDPMQVPSTKHFKFVKASDEIVPVPLSQKECKDRYVRALHQVALRSIHEVFEADRRGLIRTISLEVATSAIDVSTGLRGEIPLLIVAAEREVFMSFDLSAVVPEKTLARLGAAISKNPYGLIPADRSGVRRA